MFRSAFLRRGDPSRGLLLSALLHVIVVTAIISEPLYDFGSTGRLFQPKENPPPEHEVIYYTKADLLPLISPPKPKVPVRRAPPPPAPSRVPIKLAFRPAQTIVSQPPAPDNRRQTIVQPDVPRLEARAEIRVPNLIRWNAPNLPAPVVSTEIRRPVAEPVQELSRPVSVERSMPSIPKPEGVRADASAIPLGPVSTVNLPRLSVPVRIIRAAAPPPAAVARASEVRAAPELPTALARGIDPNLSLLPNLIAISVVPAPPSDEVVIPKGSRSGEFAASPEGSGDESTGTPFSSGTLATTGTGHTEAPGDERADIYVPGLSITGGRPSSGLSTPRGTDPGTDLKRLMASVSRPSVTLGEVKSSPLESKFFGARRVYTVYMNMPNLTSATGSWVLRFAELDEHGNVPGSSDALSTPEPIRKVDPMYVASAMRERVQGTVTLAALVLKDGTLANIRVVGSLDPRLDSSAVAALTQWRFYPAQKNGNPIDLEVLVQIPFRISSL
ncbi:MAG: TonB family protein [Acidobacteria bacterium]|nr:TonB family protein [Acidobacteriota bacterium]